MTAPPDSDSAPPPDPAARRPAAASASPTPGARIRRAAVWGLAASLGQIFLDFPAQPDEALLAWTSDVLLATAFAWWAISGRRAERIVGAIGLASVLFWLGFAALLSFRGATGIFPVGQIWVFGFLALFSSLLAGIPFLIRAGAALAALSVLPACWSLFRDLSGRLLASRGDPFFARDEFYTPFETGFWILFWLLLFVSFVKRARIGAPTPEETAEDAARAEARRVAREEALRYRREAHERALREAAASAAALAAARAAAFQQAAAVRPPAFLPPPRVTVPPPSPIPHVIPVRGKMESHGGTRPQEVTSCAAAGSPARGGTCGRLLDHTGDGIRDSD